MSKIPVTRYNNFWYSDNDFNLDIEMSRDLIEGDANFKVILFRIDKFNTDTDDVYGESSIEDIHTLPPIEIPARITIESPEQINYGTNGSLLANLHGDLIFKVFTKTLEELNVDITNGDVVGYSSNEDDFKYYEVVNDGRINVDGGHTWHGYKPYFRTVKCITLDSGKFNR